LLYCNVTVNWTVMINRLINFVTKYGFLYFGALGLIAAGILSGLKHYKNSHLILSVVAIIEIGPMLWDLWQNYRLGKFGLDILAITAIIASILLKEYWAAMTVVSMYFVNKMVEASVLRRAESVFVGPVKPEAIEYRQVKKGKELTVLANEIKPGDKFIINSNGFVPVEAEIIDGQANFDESWLSGDDAPVTHQIGWRLISGSILIDGQVTVEAKSTFKDSQCQKLTQILNSSIKTEAPISRLAERNILPFTVLSFALALAAWFITGDSIRFLDVIIVATPYSLIMTGPLSTSSGLASLSLSGIFVKTAQTLETLSLAKSIVFSKSGTVTKNEMSVASIKTFGSHKSSEILALAASVEQVSTHRVAEAIKTDAKLKKLKLVKLKKAEQVVGMGVRAQNKGKLVVVGTLKFLEDNDVKFPPSFKHSSANQSAIYVASDSLIGVIYLSNELKSEAADSITSLKAMGLSNIYLLSGDSETSTNDTARTLGISKVHAEASAAEKITMLSRIKERPSVFIGSDLSDGPIMSSASASIVIDATSYTRMQDSAGVVIVSGNLAKVADCLSSAKRTLNISRRTILLGVVVSLVLMVIFASGSFRPIYGAFAEEVVNIFVLVLAYRARSTKHLMVS
jgi:P-type E1-E2 ATPase